MTDRILTDGSPVPDDDSHKELRPDGQQKGYVVLSEEERAKEFVKPYRDRYQHITCGGVTAMGRALSETYARDPYFYSGAFCCNCGSHFPLDQFKWSKDGESLDPLLQASVVNASPKPAEQSGEGETYPRACIRCKKIVELKEPCTATVFYCSLECSDD